MLRVRHPRQKAKSGFRRPIRCSSRKPLTKNEMRTNRRPPSSHKDLPESPPLARFVTDRARKAAFEARFQPG
jgi:hypothetical protein